MTVRLHLSSSGPPGTIQDGGRPGHMRHGVPMSGPLDRVAFATANLAVGNAADQAGIEVSVAGLTVEVEGGEVTLGLAGGGVTIEHRGHTLAGWRVLTLGEGDRLRIRPGGGANWAYVGIAGRLRTRRWLGSAATHAAADLGGGVLHDGQILEIDDAHPDRERDGEIQQPPDPAGKPARVVIGPQAWCFAPTSVEALLGEEWQVSPRLDRMGVGLVGPDLTLDQGHDVLSIPSQPVVRGSVQVDGSGQPTVLLADHQTTGGYPKIATVLSTDLDGLSQWRPGTTCRFEEVDPEQAIQIVRAQLRRRATFLAGVTSRDRTLSHRLARDNLIGGVFGGHVQDTST